ncbi:MAG: 4Fe-4S binding protein [candidate division WOR-3 bacterium]
MARLVSLAFILFLLTVGLISCAQDSSPQVRTHYYVDTVRCRGCGTCVDSCRFNAIRLNSNTGKAQIDTLLCTSCGTCKRVCPYQAIKDTTY